MNDRFTEPVYDIDIHPSYIIEGSGSFTVNQVASVPLVVNNMNSELVFKITSDGQIIIGNGYTPTAAADEFISQLQLSQDYILLQEYISQLESSIEAWKENLNDY